MLQRLKRATALAIGTSLLVASLAACNTAGPEAVVATVNGEKIYRWELDKYYNEGKKYMEQTSGIENLDSLEYQEQRIKYKKECLEALIDDAVVTLVAKEEGYGLTEEETAAADAQYQTLHDNAVAEYKKNYASDANADKKAEEDWNKFLASNHMTEAFLRQNIQDAAVRDKYSKDIFKEMEPTEDEIKAKYEELTAADKEKYATDSKAYEDAAAVPGGVVFYNPAGYVRVKQIMFSIPEDIDKKIREIDDTWGRAILESNALTEEKGKDDPTVQKLQGEMLGYDEQSRKLYEEGYAAIQSKVDACVAELKAGTPFEDLIAKYNDDPGMTMMPISEYGYLVGPDSAKNGLLKGFVDGALALKDVDQVSEPVKSIQGMHIIKLTEKVAEGPVPLEDCKENVKAMIVGQPRMTLLNEIANKKKADGTLEIKRYFDRIG